MAVEIISFDEESVRKLARMYNDLLHKVAALEKRVASAGRTASPISCLVGKADANIAALAGDVPGSGAVSIWGWRGGTWQDLGYNETAYNFSAAEVTAATFLILLRHEQSGEKLVIFESCGA